MAGYVHRIAEHGNTHFRNRGSDQAQARRHCTRWEAVTLDRQQCAKQSRQRQKSEKENGAAALEEMALDIAPLCERAGFCGGRQPCGKVEVAEGVLPARFRERMAHGAISHAGMPDIEPSQLAKRELPREALDECGIIYSRSGYKRLLTDAEAVGIIEAKLREGSAGIARMRQNLFKGDAVERLERVIGRLRFPHHQADSGHESHSRGMPIQWTNRFQRVRGSEQEDC